MTHFWMVRIKSFQKRLHHLKKSRRVKAFFVRSLSHFNELYMRELSRDSHGAPDK